MSDQTGTPTWANSLAGTLWALADKPGVTGIYHWTDGGQASWYEFAVAIQEEALQLGLLDKEIPIHAISSSEYPVPARRPRYSVLDCAATCAALAVQQIHWRDNLRHMLREMTN